MEFKTSSTSLLRRRPPKRMPQGCVPTERLISGLVGKGKGKVSQQSQIQILVTNHQTGHGTEEKKSYLRKKLFANLEDWKSLSFHTHKGKAV
ncbi:hypothetical protein CEXT_406021 [Caerostris extrusa]|uniref:LAGLIDADG homing endonuclease n=1 Tax=Caerostris extrusa TaxID=172846 RepID=A0AAV4NTJ6_CAEEX|nr:hypothetical protein CEXT_406021 [Caerostris extrusa]